MLETNDINANSYTVTYFRLPWRIILSGYQINSMKAAEANGKSDF